MTAFAKTSLPASAHRLLQGQTLHLYLDRASGLQIEQGSVQLVTHEWLAERWVPMTQRMDAGAVYEPVASGWVFLQALPGETLRFGVVSRPGRFVSYIAPVFARLARFARVRRAARTARAG